MHPRNFIVSFALIAIAACQSKSPPSSVGSGSAAAIGSAVVTGSGGSGSAAKPAVVLVGCALAQREPGETKSAGTGTAKTGGGAKGIDDDGIEALEGEAEVGGGLGKPTGIAPIGGAGYPGPGGLRTIDSGRIQGQVVPKDAAVSGELERDIVRRVVLRNRARLSYCYTKRLVQVPALTGKVTIAFEIDATGKVADGVKATATPDEQLGTCMTQSIRVFTFPAPKSGTAKVVYTFELKPPSVATPTDDPFGLEPPGAIAKRPPPPKVPPKPPAPKATVDVTQWTPYAVLPIVDAPGLAERTKTAIDAKLGQLQLCASDARGSIRAMVRVTNKGTIARARVGGLGDDGVEGCIGSALVQVETGTPAPAFASDVEVACDFTAGGPAKPWRASRTLSELGKYVEVIVGSGASIMPPKVLVDRAAMIVAAADADVASVRTAIAGVAAAPYVLVTVGGGLDAALLDKACLAAAAPDAKMATLVDSCAAKP